MRKLRYSIGMKTGVIIIQQILFVVLVISILVVSALFQKNILNFDDIKNKSFESSGYFDSLFQKSVNDVLEFTNLRKKFETEGNYDAQKVVDIFRYYNRQEISEQVYSKEEKFSVQYYLGDLVEWARDNTTSSYNFVYSYYLDNGIHQQQTIYRNENQVFDEEKVVDSLGEMAPEIQEDIVRNIEHYYGGSYSNVQNDLQTKGTDAEAVQDTQSISMKEDNATAETVVVWESEMTPEQEQAAVLENIIQRVLDGELYELSGIELSLLLENMDSSQMEQTETCFFIDEEYLPLDGTKIWDNFIQGNITSSQMKNRYAALEYTLNHIGAEVNAYKKGLNLFNIGENGSNVYYWIKKGVEDTLYTNITEENASKLQEFGKKMGRYLFYQEEDMRLETNVKGMEDIFYNSIESVYGGKGNTLFISVDTSFSKEDSFYQAKQEYERMYPWIYISIVSMAISGLGCLICVIYLSMVSGKKGETEEVSLCWFDGIPTEISFVGAAFTSVVTIMMYGNVFSFFDGEGLTRLLILAGATAFVSTAFLMLFYLSFVRRIRAGMLWKGSITCKILRGISGIFQGRRPMTKMVVWFGIHLLGCFLLLPLFTSGYSDTAKIGAVIFAGISIAEAVLIIREGKQRNEVLEGIRSISQGDLELKINAKELKGDNRKLAEAVNTIGDGLFHAVDDSMKNERLKADLITNVSHDIKTPLTSIINYVDLMKREDIQSERVQNYLKVLEQKSQRLKQLTEDLVEASKVSSGNIVLEMERINFVELVYQTGGEFNEKFEAKGLTAITKLPKEPIVILADGRRIWRVLENLYHNVEKYAMPNTRVYVDMDMDEESVWLSIKNISENALNIQADELTERFIRGDVSRSTEGSGLGLSIAKNLTNLMEGDFEIYLDGDLFKATIRFKRESEKQKHLETDEKNGEGLAIHE